MGSKKGLRYVAASVLLISIASMLLKFGVTQIGEITLGQLKSQIWIIVLNPFIILGIVLYVLSSFTWLLAISKIDLSKAYPILSSAYALIPILSWLIFKDVIPVQRWVGIAIICLGVMLMSRS